MYRYRREVLEELAGHGLKPRPTTSPQFLRDALRDLYNFEIRALRNRCRRGEFSTKELPRHVIELRKRYLLLSVPIERWIDHTAP